MSKGTYNQLFINNDNIESGYLTKDANITFFNKLFRRYVNFSTEEKEIIIPSLKQNIKNISVIIPRIGDFISNVYLIINLPKIFNKYNKWTYKQMKEYLKKYGLNYDFQPNNPTDFITEEDFLKIIGKFDGQQRSSNNYGLIPEYIDTLEKKKNLYEIIIKITSNLNPDDYNSLDEYKKDLFDNLFSKLSNYPDMNLLKIIFDYLWAYIQDENSISTFEIPEEIPEIEKFINIFNHNFDDDKKYIISTDTPLINQEDNINIFDSKSSWIADHIVDNDTDNIIEPREGTIAKVNNPFDNMSVNFLKQYCNMDEYSSGFGYLIDNKILYSFKEMNYFKESSLINNNIDILSIFPYYLPYAIQYDIQHDKLIRRKFYLPIKDTETVINGLYKVKSSVQIEPKINEESYDIIIVKIHITNITNNKQNE